MARQYQKYKECYSMFYHIYHKIFVAWKNMKARCYSQAYPYYYNYGGRGIIVCKEWLNDFEIFKEWALANGWAKELTLDRIDTNKNYYPNNCRWGTYQIQAINQRICKLNKSGYSGIFYYKRYKKWQADIKINYKQIYLGRFISKKEAVETRNNYVIKHNLSHKIQEWTE